MGTGDVDELLRFLDEARADAAAAERTRGRWLRQQAVESATLAGTLLDLGERCARVAIQSSSGRTHVGPLVAVGADFCMVAVPGGVVCVALEGLVAVRPEPGAGAPAAGDRVVRAQVRLLDVLAAAAGDRPRVQVLPRAGSAGVAGELVAVGVDVLTVRLQGGARPGGAVCLVAAQSLVDVVFTSG